MIQSTARRYLYNTYHREYKIRETSNTSKNFKINFNSKKFQVLGSWPLTYTNNEYGYVQMNMDDKNTDTITVKCKIIMYNPV